MYAPSLPLWVCDTLMILLQTWVQSLAISKETMSEVVKLVYNYLYIIICLKVGD